VRADRVGACRRGRAALPQLADTTVVAQFEIELGAPIP
jgi:hypothetical protein